MKLYEYQAKQLLRSRSIKVPRGGVARSPCEAQRLAEVIGCPVYVKAQVLGIARSRLGGVVRAESPGRTKECAAGLLGSTLGGEEVTCLLIEEEVKVVRELYVAFLVAGERKSYLLVAHPQGGADLEEVVRRSGKPPIVYQVNPLIGLNEHVLRRVAKGLGLYPDHYLPLRDTLKKLYEVFVNYDCELLEVNPLALNERGDLVALDPKVIIDDNSLSKHPDLPLTYSLGTLKELKARRRGLTYVEVKGDIGIIGNGAGLTMATMDLVKELGGKPGCFIDIGGGAKAERVKTAVELALESGVRKILVNILGGITRCDEVAKGIISALRGIRGVKVVVRMLGTLEEEGRALLSRYGIPVYDDLEDAVREVIDGEHVS